jgi:CubicO group peptidase (beta-lactamase class C family)
MSFLRLVAAILVFAIASTFAEEFPGAEWSEATPASVDLDAAKLAEARDYALTGGGAGCIIRHGKRVMAWGDARERFDLKSTTKSFGSIALGLAIGDGKVRLDDKARTLHPAIGVPPESNVGTGWPDEITLFQLATQTAGFEKPGGWARLLFRPGTKWSYSDAGPNWLAECLTLAWKRDVAEVMFERVFTPLGISPNDLTWRKNSYRPAEIDGLPRREFGAGISADIEALSRIGYLMLREGRWREAQILPRDYVALAGKPAKGLSGLEVLDPQNYGRASTHYGLLWWNNGDETIEGVPVDAYWSWGLYDSLIVVIPSLDIVAVRAGKSWARLYGADQKHLQKPFLQPIAAAVKSGRNSVTSLSVHPQSNVIRDIHWAPVETIVKKAQGSDNWPITWGDEDKLYTAYGDGQGFEPMLKEKLSLGLARISGDPPEFTGENLRAPTAEQKGDGQRGKKASGLLMVDGVLYLWARNAGNAQLAWSDNHGATWTWAEWKFTTSFGCPTFLNFGANYQGARDGFVYIFSPDTDGAYERVDRMVLARVPKEKIRERDAYEFLEELDINGQPKWTRDVAQRGAVFEEKGRCYRSSISYNAGLKRYLWVQTGLGTDTRYAGGFAIYDSPEPWGPWTTAYHTDAWDVGPGETASLPTKWMSADGRTVHIVFSGNDCFSVRQGTLVLTK